MLMVNHSVYLINIYLHINFVIDKISILAKMTANDGFIQ